MAFLPLAALSDAGWGGVLTLGCGLLANVRGFERGRLPAARELANHPNRVHSKIRSCSPGALNPSIAKYLILLTWKGGRAA
jgi:hypothetical protein